MTDARFNKFGEKDYTTEASMLGLPPAVSPLRAGVKCPDCGGIIYKGTVDTDNEGDVRCWKLNCACGTLVTVFND